MPTCPMTNRSPKDLPNTWQTTLYCSSCENVRQVDFKGKFERAYVRQSCLLFDSAPDTSLYRSSDAWMDCLAHKGIHITISDGVTTDRPYHLRIHHVRPQLRLGHLHSHAQTRPRRRRGRSGSIDDDHDDLVLGRTGSREECVGQTGQEDEWVDGADRQSGGGTSGEWAGRACTGRRVDLERLENGFRRMVVIEAWSAGGRIVATWDRIETASANGG